MQNLWVFIGLFLVAALCWVWLPFFFSKKSLSTTSRLEENKQAYWERKKELEDELSQGNISQASFNARMEELSLSALQDMKSDQGDTPVTATTLPLWWPLSITVIVLSTSIFTYSTVGYTPSKEELARQQQEQLQKKQLTSEIIALEKKTKSSSARSQDWFSLGYLYIESGDYGKAVNAFNEVQSLIGEHAEVLGAKAQAMYYAEGEQLTDSVNAIVKRSLALDPVDPATNILLGMHNYKSGNFAVSTKHWQRVMRSSRDDVNKSALLQSIRAAQQQAGITAEDYQISVNVDLSSQMQSYAQATDTVFIYAHAPEQRMPLAIHRTTVDQLPVSVSLNDQKAMSPIASLSSVDQVIVKAIVSKAGQAGMQVGDLFAQSEVIETLDNQQVQLTIDQQFKGAQVVPHTAIRVQVKIATHIQAQIADDDTVFIFAAPSKGEKIPLVAEKLKVSDLPKTISLQNAPDQPDLLAQAQNVDIHALITKPNQTGFSTGTPRGMLQNVAIVGDPTKEDVTTVTITIDSIVGEG